jgi:hypothetical protein
MATKIQIQNELTKPLLASLEALISNDATESDEWLKRTIKQTKSLWGK